MAIKCLQRHQSQEQRERQLRTQATMRITGFPVIFEKLRDPLLRHQNKSKLDESFKVLLCFSS